MIKYQDIQIHAVFLTHVKISIHLKMLWTHATHPNYAIFLTHAKTLLTIATHVTHAKIWRTLPTNPRTHATHATHATHEPTLPTPPSLFSKFHQKVLVFHYLFILRTHIIFDLVE